MHRGLAFLLALACLPAFPGLPGAMEDELVPEGAWLLRLGQARRTESRAISRGNVERPLLDYLVPDPAVRDELDGDVRREVERSELTLTFGLGDTWNLLLVVPQVSLSQASTVSTTSGDPAAEAEVTRLAPASVSGLGRLRLGSLHRPVFSDRHGFVLGYGVDWPAADPERPWVGRGTLESDRPFRRIYGLLHYTFYPFIRRARFDLRSEAGHSLREDLMLPGGSSASVSGGNDVSLSAGWQQELGPVVTGFGFRVHRESSTEIEGQGQSDRALEWAGRLTLGLGNLRALERGPVAFPFVVLLTYEETLQGFNVPIREELRLTLQTYF